jgi:hypothetical protein
MKMRIEVTAVLEYEADPTDYDTFDPAEIAKMDLETAEDDVYLFLDNERTAWDIKVMPV